MLTSKIEKKRFKRNVKINFTLDHEKYLPQFEAKILRISFFLSRKVYSSILKESRMIYDERERERVAYETARKIIFVSVPLSRTSQRFTLLIRRFRGPCATMYNIPPYLKNESNKNAFRRGGMRARRTGNGDTDFSFISASWWYVSTEISLVRELWYS